ncbi:hypothetical protein J4211_01830 [Candidatus Woesearchaeota archaeon]|nr:hypothetical protein [Candidatus Woesearchaeota archaeon]
MKKIATMTLAALLSVLSPGCGSKGSTQVSLPHPTNTPSPTTPTVPTPTATPATPTSQIFADLIGATDDGSYAVVRDIRVPTYGQLISINTATGQDHTIQVNPTSTSLAKIVGNEGIFQKVEYFGYNQPYNSDIVTVNLTSGKIEFDTNTPNQREWLTDVAGRNAVFVQYDNTGKNNVGLLDLLTKKTKLLSAGNAYVARNDEHSISVVTALPNSKNTLMLIDRVTGVTSTAIDLNSNPDAIGFFDSHARDIVTYRTFANDIIFNFLNGHTSRFIPPNSNSNVAYDILAMSADASQAIVQEQDFQTQKMKIYHLFLYGSVATHQEIDFAAAGLSVNDVYGFLVGRGQTMFQIDSHATATNRNEVRFYNPHSKQIVDLLSPALTTGTVKEAFTTIKRDDSASLDVRVDVNGNQNNQVMTFDGWSVNAPFAQADSSYHAAINSTGNKTGSGAVVLARRGNFTDIYSLDLTTGATFALDSTPRNVGSVAITQDGQTVAYSLQANNDNGLYVATNGWTLPKELRRSIVPVFPLAFTRDGKSLFAQGNSGPQEIELINVATGVGKHVCNK